MVSKENIQRYLTIAILASVFLYAAIKSGKSIFFDVEASQAKSAARSFSNFLLEVWDIGSLIVSIVLASVFVNLPVVIRLILQDDYIAGKYEGTTNSNSDLRIKQEPDSHENFLIKQTLVSTTISGFSVYEVPSRHTTWEGNLFYRKGRTFKFIIEIDTDPYEYGILTLHFSDDNFYGIYISANPGTNTTYQIKGKRTKKLT